MTGLYVKVNYLGVTCNRYSTGRVLLSSCVSLGQNNYILGRMSLEAVELHYLS
jgi:hypothetical protein